MLLTPLSVSCKGRNIKRLRLRFSLAMTLSPTITVLANVKFGDTRDPVPSLFVYVIFAIFPLVNEVLDVSNQTIQPAADAEPAALSLDVAVKPVMLPLAFEAKLTSDTLSMMN